MALRPLTPATQPTARAHLTRLLVALQSVQDFNPALLSYTMFPLTHMLSRNNLASLDPAETGYVADTTLEPLLGCLAFLVERWKSFGMDLRMSEQLWRVGVRVAEGSGGRRRAEETVRCGVELLGALLAAPNEEQREAVFPRSIGTQSRLLPLLFHTISTLVDTATSAMSLTLIQRALEVQHAVIHDWFTLEQANVLASVMPGIISGVVKLVCGTPSAPVPRRAFQTGWNEIVTAPSGTPTQGPRTIGTASTCTAIKLLTQVLIQTIGDAPLEACGVLPREPTRDLDDLINGLHVSDDEERTIVGSPTLSAVSEATATTADPFPRLTPAYLAFTRTQILISLQSILPRLAGHHASHVRLAAVEAVEKLALECRRSLADDAVQHLLLGTLLGLGSPYQPDPAVMRGAQRAVRRLLSGQARAWRAVTRSIMERELQAFPMAVGAHSEARVEASVGVLTALAGLATATSDSEHGEDVAAALRRDFGRLLGPEGGVHKWSGPLLRCLELGRPVEMDDDVPGGRDARAWELARIDAPEPTTTTAPADFPVMFLVNVESRTTSARIGRMFEALGAAAGVGSLHTVEHLIHVASKSRAAGQASVASSAMWLIARVVDGLAGVVDQRAAWVDGKRVRRAARRVVDLVVQFDDDDSVAEEPRDAMSGGEELAVVERRRGLGTISKLLDDSKRTPASATDHARKLHAAVHAQLVTCIDLALLATCARILSTSFRRHLISTLYIILSHLGSPHALVRRYAQIALGQVAYHAGYASAQNLILENVDYVINIVSQRMTYDRLDPLAPVVLISMIKLVGEPIVPLVQDIIADVFDALDDFHGYALLSSTVLAVMDTLMKAMAGEVSEDDAPMVSTSVRMRRAPNPERDLERFTTWYGERAVKARQTMDELLERAPHEPWDQPKVAPDADEGPANASDEKEVPPTRAQEVCMQMMQKSIYFLTHANPFITARVLSLFASGVPVLVTQRRESDALPLVHQAWPFILNRLQDPAPFVRTEAAALVECLARRTGDFMSRRILDDAWPIFRQLLDAQKQRDEHSALAVRGVRGTTSAYTVSHRLYLSVIRAMHLVIQRVPIADDLFWEIVLAFRPFLDARVHQELGAAAVKLYRAMAERDEDAVWLALNATMGTVVGDQSLLTYLRDPGLDIQHRVELVL